MNWDVHPDSRIRIVIFTRPGSWIQGLNKKVPDPETSEYR
jgi:hypothetical protein